MSRFVDGKLYFVTDTDGDIAETGIDLALVKYCIEQNIAIHFLDCATKIKRHIFKAIQKEIEVQFQLSDKFMYHNCDWFMEGLIYSSNGIPLTLQELKDDIHKICTLFEIAFSYSIVRKAELKIFDREPNEDDFKIRCMKISELPDVLLEEYVKQNGNVPTIKYVISR